MKYNTTSNVEEHVSIKTAAKLLDCSEQFFRNLVSQRSIRYVKVRKMVRIPVAELQKLIVQVDADDSKVLELMR
jgi:excisionase family DNA binding protein